MSFPRFLPRNHKPQSPDTSSMGEFRGGESPSDGGLGVSPRISVTFLGRVGGKKNAHVTPTTPTLPNPHNTPHPRGCGIHPADRCLHSSVLVFPA